MLVLSRQENEVIRIGENISIRVVSIRGGKVRIGIEAPTSLAVHREEVYQQVKKEKEEKQLQASKVADLPQTLK